MDIRVAANLLQLDYKKEETNDMMRRRPASEMAKTYIYMPREEYQKYSEMSEDLTMNQFFMRCIRKAVADLEAATITSTTKGDHRGK